MAHEPDSARIAELEDDNQRLRNLLQRENASRELRHRARNALAMLRGIIRKSADSDRNLDEYIAHLEDRLDSIARAYALADAHGFIDLHTLIADELLFYSILEGDRLSINGPAFRFHPKAGQLFALAIHELAVNAVEHGVITQPDLLQITWTVAQVEDHPLLTFVWHEKGSGELIKPSRQGFGTEVLTRMLAYDLNADTKIVYGGNLVRCEVRLPVTDDIGVVVNE